MSFEEAVRAKHAFQAALKEFLRYASAMTNEEIELAMGRIADRMSAESSEETRYHYKVKGTALKIYFDIRTELETNAQTEIRKSLNHEHQEFLQTTAENEWELKEAEYAAERRRIKQQHDQKLVEYSREREAWYQERKKIGLMNRLFKSRKMRPEPVRPEYPPIPFLDYKDRYVSNYLKKSGVNMEEFLLERVAEFQLFPIKHEDPEFRTYAYDVTPDDVKLLAPN